MHILMTNDDGAHAPGLVTLARALSRRHTLTIAAPDRERSAASHSMTLDRPLTARPVSLGIEDVRAFAINGTPVDCVHLGLGALTDGPVDLLVSGINNGFNLGGDIAYSGTVHAALEGATCGVRSLALSLGVAPGEQKKDAEGGFERAARAACQIVDALPLRALDDCVLNVNFPSRLPDSPQIRVCPQGVSLYETTYRRMDDPFGREFYWVYAVDSDPTYNEERKTDVYWASRGFVTVTPLRWNATDEAAMESARGVFAEMGIRL